MTERHLEVLLSAAEGETIAQTAARAGCSIAWIARLRAELCAQLGAHNMPHAVSLAYQQGLLKA